MRPERPTSWRDLLRDHERSHSRSDGGPRLAVLCRTVEQIEAALDCGVAEIYIDFETSGSTATPSP